MRRFVKVLKEMFTVPNPPVLPATAFEMTMHDALRICVGRTRTVAGPPSTRRDSSPMYVCWCRSEFELDGVWCGFDTAARLSGNRPLQ